MSGSSICEQEITDLETSLQTIKTNLIEVQGMYKTCKQDYQKATQVYRSLWKKQALEIIVIAVIATTGFHVIFYSVLHYG